MKKGQRLGLQEGRKKAARNLIQLRALTDTQIAEATGLSLAQVEALRDG